MPNAPSGGWDVVSIQAANRVRGWHFFDAAVMRGFRSRVMGVVAQGPGGVFFVTSERGPNNIRAYTVRQFHPDTADVTDASPFQAYRSRNGALAAAHRMAVGIPVALSVSALRHP